MLPESPNKCELIVEEKYSSHSSFNIKDIDQTISFTNYCSDICYIRLTDTAVLASKQGVGVGMEEAGHFNRYSKGGGGHQKKGKDKFIGCHGQEWTGGHRL